MSTVSIHGLQLTLDPRLAWSGHLHTLLADVAAASALSPAALSGTLSVRHSDAHDEIECVQSLAPRVARSRNCLVDHKYHVTVEWGDAYHAVLHTRHACPEWLSWLLQLAVLRSRATFVHAAGLVQDGQAYLFAGQAGVGKTALAAVFVQDFGYQLLGDDVTLLARDGTCYGHPRALVVHPEHRSFFPTVFAGGAGPAAPAHLGKWIRRVGRVAKPALRINPRLLERARLHHPANARILPSTAFGPGCLAAPAPLAAVIWLERRTDASRVTVRAADSPFDARLFAGMMTEFDAWCVHVSNIALANGMLNAAGVYRAWLDTLSAAVRDVPAFTLSIPAVLPFAEMPSAVHAALQRSGVLESPKVRP